MIVTTLPKTKNALIFTPKHDFDTRKRNVKKVALNESVFVFVGFLELFFSFVGKSKPKSKN